MFKNRAFVVRMVDEKKAPEGTEPVPVDIAALGQEIVKNTVMIIGAYVAADTLRQIILIGLKARV